MILCPKCDKGLRTEEIKNGKCENCKLEFTVKGVDESNIDDELFLKRFKKEVKTPRNKERIDYHATAIDMLKASLPSVVLYRTLFYSTFYLVQDCEIIAMLFRIKVLKRELRIDFDTLLRNYKSVRYQRDFNQKQYKRGYRSQLVTRDLGYMMEICLDVYNRKKVRVVSNKRSLNYTKVGLML